jgi:hypothetical protein
MSELRPKLQKFRNRDWEEVRNSWLGHVPRFPFLGAPPDPGLEKLQPLLDLDFSKEQTSRFADIPGLRSMALWEAVFLFHKCSHANLAAQRLGRQGMHSWCYFNGYHSAYMGARGIMTLLGVPIPDLKGRQVGIDLFPEPEGKKKPVRSLTAPQFQEFLTVNLPRLDQRNLWEVFQRVIRVTDAACWDTAICKELLKVSHKEISPPRNHYLYKANYWPLGDLMSDSDPPALLSSSFGTELDEEAPGFLLRLSFAVYRLFEQLIRDLAKHSAVIKAQMDASRFLSDAQIPELDCYRDFVAQIREAQPEVAP